MSFHRRIRTIYGKELIDILRDRRTLIAMILVPIVLYPLLMLGSIQAVSYQTASLEDETFVIGVSREVDPETGIGSDRQRDMLTALLRRGVTAWEYHRSQLDPESEEAAEYPSTPLIERVKINDSFASAEELEQAVRDRKVHIGVIFEDDHLGTDAREQVRIDVKTDLKEVRSVFAERRFNDMVAQIETQLVERRKRSLGLPANFDQPFNVTTTDLSAPSSILGQILPLILVLMTITGAIYPAIDLTAGERERGTLESLMASPVPVIDLIVGKFLVVTTVAIMGATLNLASVSATVYFGGFDQVIASTGGRMPLATMAFILLCLIPFAILMSAIMIAVCSYARSFKEAQNYVTPVILAVLIPGGIAALPTTRLEGIMLVMPVGNMVLLARDLLLGGTVPMWHVLMVVLSTTLYAGAAVAVAANVFGKESVVFADAGSWKTTFARALIKPATTPSISMGLIVVALLFPLWFFVQSALSPEPDEVATGLLVASGWLMPVLFVLMPIAILGYWKVNIARTFALHMPSPRYMLAAVLIGISAWVPAHELNVLQQGLFGMPQAVMESAEAMAEAIGALPPVTVFVLIAIIPAISEELLFRGFLLSSLRGSARKWTAIVISAAVFGVFHFFLFKFAVTASLGVVLAYLCWQSRSILPAIVAHFLHNAIGATTVINPNWPTWIGLNAESEWVHFPIQVLILGSAVFVIGLLVASRTPTSAIGQPIPAIADGHRP